MFFFDAEKRGMYLEGWSMRQFAFDSQRRHLYYSERERSTGGEAAHHVVQWKKKLKVTRITVLASEHEFRLNDPHLKETDFFTLRVHGKTRRLAAGEPQMQPLLCNTAGTGAAAAASPPTELELSGIRGEVHDPFQLCELYEALRDQFSALRRNNAAGLEDPAASNGTGAAHNEQHGVRTIQSPRSAAAGERHILATLRCKCEKDFLQVRYVMELVLGYDKLCVRPYRGLPPYDPRNGIPLAHVPMHLWHVFKALDDSVFYSLIRGDLVGRDDDGNAMVSLPGVYLCITHDMVLVVRENGMIPRWIRLQDVNTFESNTVAKRPFFAFLTDDPSPDILFIPKPPVFGPSAIAEFSGAKAVRSVRLVLEETCFASSVIRRAIRFVDADWTDSVRAYFNGKDKSRRFKFTPLHGFNDSLSCLLPKVQLAKVWRDVIDEQHARSQDDVAAIPLEGTGSNRVFSSMDMSSVRQRMDAVRSRVRSQDEIVGLPLSTLLGCPRERANAALETPTIRPDSFIGKPLQHEDEEEDDVGMVVYQQPGAQYYSPDTTPNVLQPGAEHMFGPESHVEELVNTSLIAIGERNARMEADTHNEEMETKKQKGASGGGGDVYEKK